MPTRPPEQSYARAVRQLRTRIDEAVEPGQAAIDLQRYFAGRPEAEAKDHFTGRFFEQLGGGGDRPAVADRFTAKDLLAVTMLGVNVPAHVSANILEGPLGRELASLLTQVPTTLLLAEASADDIADGSPAERAWSLLEKQDHVGWVTAGKVMARKRPALIPVYDSVVRCWLGHPARYWEPLRQVLVEDGRVLVERLEQLRATPGVPNEVSLLRVLDVVLWMRHHKAHRLCSSRSRDAVEQIAVS